ncbi:hypothetical protein [Paludisphaera sp.]|uniref:hypothetical protein n=1 Tax=Paludisphaera sp. TaxID=2017432 RepID=UPI00301D8A90
MADDKESVVVTIADSHLTRIKSVADELRDAGLEVRQVLSTSGIISGKAAPTARHALEAVPGVIAVEPDEEMRAI